MRDALRSSPGDRQQSMMTYPKAQEIVRQAYLNVLRREPDSAPGIREQGNTAIIGRSRTWSASSGRAPSTASADIGKWGLSPSRR